MTTYFRRPQGDDPGSLNPVYDLLDARVIAGAAEDVLVKDVCRGRAAELLEDVAALAGMLTAVGVGPGHPAAVRLEEPEHRLVAVLAALRLGARVVANGEPVLGGDLPWEVAMRAGRTDPAPVAELQADAPMLELSRRLSEPRTWTAQELMDALGVADIGPEAVGTDPTRRLDPTATQEGSS